MKRLLSVVCVGLVVAWVSVSGLAIETGAAPGETATAWQEASSTVLDGVFTAAQARRGQRVYRQNCESCHGSDLRGDGDMSPGIAGSDFATPAELDLNARITSEQRDLRYLTIPIEKFRQETQAADEEIRAYYDSNKNDFLSRESVELDYIELTAEDFFQPVEEAVLREAYEEDETSMGGPNESTERTKIFPSPIRPVRATSTTLRMISSARVSSIHIVISTLGRKAWENSLSLYLSR